MASYSRKLENYKKGKRFEDEVAQIFKLLGAQVTKGILINNKKVDILAEYKLPAGGNIGKHRIIVECKNQNKPRSQNATILEFAGLLNAARKTNKAEGVEIITKVPWGEAARGAAEENGIGLLTYDEKISQLLDFTSYLNKIISKFDGDGKTNHKKDPPLASYYVNLRAQMEKDGACNDIPVLNEYVKKWIDDNSTKQLAILGGFGTGKSSFCLKIARDLACSFNENRSNNRIPILINLRDFTKSLSIESLILLFLSEECYVTNPNYELFRVMNEAGMFLILLDGFDEMALKVDQETLEANLQEVEKLAVPDNAKVIITSRDEFFVHINELRISFDPKLAPLSPRETEYSVINIYPWDKLQTNTFLQKRVSLIQDASEEWMYYRDEINKLTGFIGLSKRPVLLDMIVKTLPQLIDKGGEINLPDLYESYLLGELTRQKSTKKRQLLLSNERRFELLELFSIEFIYNQLSLTFDTAHDCIKKTFTEHDYFNEDLGYITRDFLSCSFLYRTKNEFYFSHRSFLEYFVARALKKEIDYQKYNFF